MYQIIHNLALGAALIALVASLWQDWGTFTTVKRMLVSYLGFFFLGAIMALAVKLVGALEKDPGQPSRQATSNSSQTKET
jgi:hypothetical protein